MNRITRKSKEPRKRRIRVEQEQALGQTNCEVGQIEEGRTKSNKPTATGSSHPLIRRLVREEGRGGASQSFKAESREQNVSPFRPALALALAPRMKSESN
ncbi:hypothetical protein GW17_00052935 [Ensete ventricosum]|nr:hypothetical protein GW17_00052935 [Ensete ventricosum]